MTKSSETSGQHYLVLGVHSWNERIFKDRIQHFPGVWHFARNQEEFESFLRVGPALRYIFFLHWSSIVDLQILEEYECVCFHMTDVPYGRGGSPLQNLILRGHQKTKLTALRMTSEIDGGPVYLKKDLCLAGNAEEIYTRACQLSADMIREIISEKIEPYPQKGEVAVFKRRKPAESEIPRLDSLGSLYDFIRMLDAEGYPKAFLRHENLRYEFHRVAIYDGRLEATVTIKLDPESNE